MNEKTSLGLTTPNSQSSTSTTGNSTPNTGTNPTSTPTPKKFNPKKPIHPLPTINLKKFDIFFNRLGKSISRTFLFALLIVVIDAFFYPELSEEIPVIYQYCNGIIQVCEYLVTIPFRFFGGILSLNLLEAIQETFSEGIDLFTSFLEWMKQVHF